MFRWLKQNLEARLPAEGQRPPPPDPVPSNPAGPPPPPKPRFFGPHFWTGFGFGILAFFVLLVGGSMLLGLWMMKAMENSVPGSKADGFLTAPPFPAVGTFSDYTLGLEKPDGTPLDAASVRGKTVFLNYWATWCGPCRTEMPAIQRLYDKTRNLGVVFLLVSDENPDKTTEYLKKNGFTMPIYRSTKSRPAAYQTQGIPATFILAPDGRIAFSHTGAARWDDDSTLAFLRSLPAASAPTSP